jgi:hypothetical protein
MSNNNNNNNRNKITSPKTKTDDVNFLLETIDEQNDKIKRFETKFRGIIIFAIDF